MEKVQHWKVARRVAEKIWAMNKYEIMARGYDYYKEVSYTFRSLDSFTRIEALYVQMNSFLDLPYKKGAVLTTLEHVWGYFKRIATIDEKNHFFQAFEKCKLIEEPTFFQFPHEVEQCKDILRSLLKKYPNRYLQFSRFLYPEQKWNEVTLKKREFLWKDGAIFIRI
ncbi:DUF1722 domain-containing protein [Alkalihalobacterium elongatum]|uniref:DUF1722 domain-containing protein n=1 Tax=Alkalihalobacterium elongatum TaxID=2675466 RepID=UPI001C1F3420|nr:DUF1722 domain-containing protein [Alkalihalobacterium elongatum]